MENSAFEKDAEDLKRILKVSPDQNKYDVTILISAIRSSANVEQLKNHELFDTLAAFNRTIGVEFPKILDNKKKSSWIGSHPSELERGTHWPIVALYIAWLSKRHEGNLRDLYRDVNAKYHSNMNFRAFSGEDPGAELGTLDIMNEYGSSILHKVDTQQAATVLEKVLRRVLPQFQNTNMKTKVFATVLLCSVLLGLIGGTLAVNEILQKSKEHQQQLEDQRNQIRTISGDLKISYQTVENLINNGIPADAVLGKLISIGADSSILVGDATQHLLAFAKQYDEYMDNPYKFTKKSLQNKYKKSKEQLKSGHIAESIKTMKSVEAIISDTYDGLSRDTFEVFYTLSQLYSMNGNYELSAEYAFKAFKNGSGTFEENASMLILSSDNYINYGAQTGEQSGYTNSLDVLRYMNEDIIGKIDTDQILRLRFNQIRSEWTLGQITANLELQKSAAEKALEFVKSCNAGTSYMSIFGCGVANFMLASVISDRGWRSTLSEQDHSNFSESLSDAITYYETASTFFEPGSKEHLLSKHFAMSTELQKSMFNGDQRSVRQVRKKMRKRLSDILKEDSRERPYDYYFLAGAFLNLYNLSENESENIQEFEWALSTYEEMNDKTKEDRLYDWADDAQYIAYSKKKLYEMKNDIGLLREIIATYQETFLILSPENDEGWGGSQINYAIALSYMGDRTGDLVFFDRALDAFYKSASFSRQKKRFYDLRIALRGLRSDLRGYPVKGNAECRNDFLKVIESEIREINFFFDAYNSGEFSPLELSPYVSRVIMAGRKTKSHIFPC